MTVAEVVEALGRERRVERIVQNIARRPLSPDLLDLCQTVYEVILTTREDRVMDLWEHDEMNFYIARIVLNQYRTSNSPWYNAIRKFAKRSVPIEGAAEKETQG